MSDIKTKYLGMSIQSPIIVGASNLVYDNDNLKRIEDAGAGAVVYKSLFEEQIQLESMQMQDELEEYNERNAEMINLFPSLMHAGPEEHLLKLRRAKETVSIPVIASLNAIYKETWLEYAKLIEQTGVDALEVNFYSVPSEMKTSGASIWEKQLEILAELKSSIKIPLSVKLSPFYANVLHVAAEMDKKGVDGFVVFNRLYMPDINTKMEEHFSPFLLSNEDEHKLPMRFLGLLFGNVKAALIGNTGVHSADDAIKMILSGADAVQVVSTLFKNKIDYIKTLNEGIKTWMDTKGYKTLDAFKGKLSKKNIQDPFVYRRAQYIDLLLKSEELMKRYALR
jgi:dihydroorotate dehydrogenase (fumarate)